MPAILLDPLVRNSHSHSWTKGQSGRLTWDFVMLQMQILKTHIILLKRLGGGVQKCVSTGPPDDLDSRSSFRITLLENLMFLSASKCLCSNRILVTRIVKFPVENSCSSAGENEKSLKIVIESKSKSTILSPRL